MQTKAEDALRDYQYQPNLSLNATNYTNVREYDQWPKELQDGMQMNEHFKQKVNVKASGVQIPIEIYEGCKLYIPFVFE